MEEIWTTVEKKKRKTKSYKTLLKEAERENDRLLIRLTIAGVVIVALVLALAFIIGKQWIVK